jgi:putative transposase
MVDFKGVHFPKEAILYAVFFYLRYPGSYLDLEEIMEERGVDVDHGTLNRWVVKFAPLMAARAQSRKKPTAESWRIDGPRPMLRKSCATAMATTSRQLYQRSFPDSGVCSGQKPSRDMAWSVVQIIARDRDRLHQIAHSPAHVHSAVPSNSSTVIPSLRAASSRLCPAIITSSSPIRIGLTKPNSAIEAANCPICWSECVRAFFA